ncbi:PilN family type IVB pilus formation outer membrane protein [Metapseudomonas furukawaii]|uniref:Conjugative transfer protein PilN in PFGI-1-like cluster n=1 Tax=Metapseudomonas furukawaii TaxID=1149133 RepID=L8MJ33_METFU|nr:PilN family type IVB pilus formation outer membrane protein [Pseudomonas furukawaii]ELS25349.1 Conjugative transfer protein PilN in PFGI-1-like cluster [Pseudomonas furukawaii]ELS27561.1 Conjugative transfer protein PilN in PFGI-1-like cluster [Pseudomonas furukawaii]BAU77392.1 conjugative transfer protein PilN in PFGI-1-like cluster [Pseudomonas furukawaii]
MKRHAWAFATLALTAAALTGCEIGRINDSMERVDKNADRASALTDALKNQVPAQRESVMFTDDQWVSTKPMVIKAGLPPALDCSVGYNESMSLQQFAQWASAQCSGVPVKVAPDALDNGASFMRASGQGNGQGNGGASAPPPVQAPAESISDLFPGAGGGVATGTASYGMGRRVALTYEGRLSSLLDTATGSLGLSWKYDTTSKTVKIFYLETRTFHVFSFNQGGGFTSVVKSGMTSSAGTSGSGASGMNGGGGGGVSGDSGSQQTTTTELFSTVVDDIENNVRSMLTLNRMAYSRTTGIMSITDRPDVLDRVQSYLDAENASITKNVLFNLEVIQVTLTDKDQYGIDWDLVYKSVNGKLGFGLKNTFPGIDASAVGGSVSILDTADSPWAGSKLLVQALSEQGRVSAKRSPSVTTLNLRTAPMQIGRVNGYLASSQTTQAPDVGATTALTPGSITSGFNMSLTPFVMPDNKQLLLNAAINMTDTPVFKTIESGNSSIENPDYGLQIFNQSVKLRSGQTLVLSGFDQTTENATKSGTGTASNFLFGGGGTRDTNRDLLVLMITPVIME